MTKSEALSYFGSAVELAGKLGIYPSAISQWPDEQIPQLREYQIKELVIARSRRQKKDPSQ